jgi:hypothetical protein
MRTILVVFAKPRARKSQLVAIRDDGSIEVALAAPPSDGAANQELVDLFADALELAKRDISIVRGHGSRHKQVAVALEADVAIARIRARLGLPTGR